MRVSEAVAAHRLEVTGLHNAPVSKGSTKLRDPSPRGKSETRKNKGKHCRRAHKPSASVSVASRAVSRGTRDAELAGVTARPARPPSDTSNPAGTCLSGQGLTSRARAASEPRAASTSLVLNWEKEPEAWHCCWQGSASQDPPGSKIQPARLSSRSRQGRPVQRAGGGLLWLEARQAQ